ncbi:MAG: hypothetical protein EP319_08735 [Deltaproteobacteria bacterium]|nr:MAG: hypothetical protein EP319_08735 [Deltaproteobacteria bacterium]
MSRTRELKTLIKFIITLILIGAVVSCVPSSPKSNRSNSSSKSSSGGSDDANGDANPPVFTNSLNYIQNGSSQSTQSSRFQVDFSTAFYMRGNSIDNFLKQDTNSQKVQCLVARFPSSISNQVLVLALRPQNFYNFSTQSREDYYTVEPNSQSINISFCQKTGLISTLNTIYSGDSIAYSFNTICPGCNLFEMISDGLGIYDINGTKILSMDVSYLSLIVEDDSIPDVPTGSSCTTSSFCQSKGFDCCSLGQCVKDKQLKNGVDTGSSEFLQALQDITNNPSAIYNYPNFYHLCTVSTTVTPTPTPTVDPDREAYLRFLEKQELYECTIPIKGEMSLCTVSYNNVSTDNTDLYYTGADDRSFSTNYSGTFGIPQHSIDRVVYAGETLFADNTFKSTGLEIGINNSLVGNDNYNDKLVIKMTKTPSSSAPDDTLRIRFKADASCTTISSNLAKCEKYYVQGQNIGAVDDHFPGSNDFIIPYFADLNRSVRVEVDGSTQLQGTHYDIIYTSPAKVSFKGSGLQVFDTQVVKLTYFVDTTTNPVMDIRLQALERIKSMCGCADLKCLLQPKFKKDNPDVIEDYTCLYPEPDLPPPPLQQTVLVSSKTVPHRYFDEEGVSHATIDVNTPPQEGTLFEYTKGDFLKPNNVNNYIGFNEILGSFTQKVGSAKAAFEVRIEKGKTYDIFVNSGTYSTCFYCGTDYYSNLAKLFPNNFTSIGSGYRPDMTATSKFGTEMRADDLIFGRACFVPPTMLPWSHDTSSDRQQQRQKRLQAQHFLFANGYNRDWYGFDYGSMIGSFDGVRWFSIGNQRRIKASTNKLFLAINQFFGDLTSESTYSVTVSASSTTPGSGSLITTDFDSDGAECQTLHQCEKDSDCAAKLGWEFVCENVTNLSSKYPSFDANANEIPDTEVIEKLIQINGTQKGSSKRCVYRGRGAPCIADYENTIDPNVTFTHTEKPALHMCSNNNYCQRFVDGVPRETFNNKISRYGKSVKVQNASSVVPEDNLDTFGLHVRSIGRPYSWIGTETIEAEAQSGLANNRVSAICIPGRYTNDARISSAHQNLPNNFDSGDKVNAMGMTPQGDGGPGVDHYLSNCSVFDTEGNYIFKANTDRNASNSIINIMASSQVLPTNALNVFNDTNNISNDITKIFEDEQITEPILERNRCLRAPGSTCHTDLDCAPSDFISSRLNIVKGDDMEAAGTMNKYEVSFWQESLVCSQEKKKTDDDYDLANNRCCREIGKEITIPNVMWGNECGTSGSCESGGSPLTPSWPNPNVFKKIGIEIGLDDEQRYSRSGIINDLYNNNDPIEMKATFLQGSLKDNCSEAVSTNCPDITQRLLDKKMQWKGLTEMAARTCCSGHWIRKFASGNGGNTTWGADKHHKVDKQIFKCRNWIQCPSTDTGTYCPTRFSCSHTEDPQLGNCLVRSTTNSEAKPMFQALLKLELMGIPQVTIDQNDINNLGCVVDPDDHTASGTGITLQVAGSGEPIVKSISAPGGANSTTTAIPEFKTASGSHELSLADEENFLDSLNPRFSADEFKCCKPAGEILEGSEDASACCTGFINPANNSCALPDYTNLSVYYNRFVSSAAKEIAESEFDDDGFITSPTTLERLACTQKICASGVVARGVALANLMYPGHEESDHADKRIRRFIDSGNKSNNFSGLADLYDAGLKYNEAVYCVPVAIANNTDSPISFLDCSTF